MPRFAIKTPPQHNPWTDILDTWREADQAEIFEAAWNFDHFYPILGDRNGPCMEASTTLAALAQATNRLRIGTMVNAMHHRHPAITANQAASLDIIANGRLILGLGAGWYKAESEANGLGLGTVRERVDRFDEGVEVIVKLLTQETTTFSGEFYQLDDARCEPKAIQSPHPPIMIGAAGEKRTIRTAARWAQMWDSLRTSPEEWPAKHEAMLGHCQDVGRDPSEITFTAHVIVDPGTDPGEIAHRANQFFERGVEMTIFSLRPPYGPAYVGPLAEALAQI